MRRPRRLKRFPIQFAIAMSRGNHWQLAVRRAIPLCKERFSAADVCELLGDASHSARSGVGGALGTLAERGELVVVERCRRPRRLNLYSRTGSFVADPEASMRNLEAQRWASSQLQELITRWITRRSHAAAE